MTIKVKEYNHERITRATHKLEDKHGNVVFMGTDVQVINKQIVRQRWERQKFIVKTVKG